MTEERCKITELLPRECACRIHRNLVSPELGLEKLRAKLMLRGQGWFFAQWRGTCLCGTPFQAGSVIRYSRESPSNFEAECCADV